MVKYTHLIERCSGFLKTGVAWKLKEHGYTFSEAYWRLREGKGLLSSYDQESLKMWSNLITSVRRDTGALRLLSSDDQTKLKDKRNKLLEKMESYRDTLENGSIPEYIYKDTTPSIIEHLLINTIGDPKELDISQQQKIWEEIDIEKIKLEAKFCMKKYQEYIDEYETISIEKRKTMLTPEKWISHNFRDTFLKDKIWQIRTGHDNRSSIKADINRKLYFIWDIPKITDNTHREIYVKNKFMLDSYKNWKNKAKTSNAKIEYDNMVSTVNYVLDLIEIPKFR